MTTHAPTRIGDLMQTRRTAAGVSRADLATMFDPPVHPTAVWRWEVGKSVIAPMFALQLPRVLGGETDEDEIATAWMHDAADRGVMATAVRNAPPVPAP